MKSVLFDFGGTLDADGTTWLERFYPLYKEVGLSVSKESFAKAFYRSDDSLPQRFPLKGLSLEKTLELQVGQVLGELAPQRADLRDPIVGRFLSDCRGHFKRNRPLLEGLARRYKLGIVSNWYGNLDSVLESEGLRGLFGVVADSGVLGTTKPDAPIFEHALKALGSSPTESLMVGDSIPRDMKGAESLGMAHVLLNPKAPTCCPRVRKIKSLVELEAALTPEASLK